MAGIYKYGGRHGLLYHVAGIYNTVAGMAYSTMWQEYINTVAGMAYSTMWQEYINTVAGHGLLYHVAGIYK